MWSRALRPWARSRQREFFDKVAEPCATKSLPVQGSSLEPAAAFSSAIPAFGSPCGVSRAPSRALGNGFAAALIPRGLVSVRTAHTGGVYVHHALPGTSTDSITIGIGILHALERLVPGTGYFRPIDNTSIGGNRAELFKEIFGFEDEVSAMQGVTQQAAFEYINENKYDDLFEEIFQKYDVLKRRHDFVVIEGTNLRGYGGDALTLNAKIASMLGSSALIALDAQRCLQDTNGRKPEDYQGLVESAKMCDIVFQKEKVDILGSIVHGLPAGVKGNQAIEKVFEDIECPIVGLIPDDPLVRSVQVQDVMTTLDAKLLYGVQDESVAMSTEVTKFIVASGQLDFMLGYIPSHSDPTKGAILITHASRSDLLLGLMHLRESLAYSNVAALVLTGGLAPSEQVSTVVKSFSQKGLLPVLLSPSPSFETCALLSRVEPAIRGSSHRKIERAQVIFDANVDLEGVAKKLLQERPIRMNPKLFQHNLFERAKMHRQHIVLPEGEEPRTIQAAAATLQRRLADITLVGNVDKIRIAAKNLRADISDAKIVDPSTSENLGKYADLFYELRKKKGISKEQARNLIVDDVNYFGTCMVASGDADGMVSGALNTTANTVRPALQVIKTPPNLPLVSSVFFMCLPDKVLVYGDCAINLEPTSEQLATIAIQSADTAAAFGVEPRVALLSYATGSSNAGPLIQKVADATSIVKKKRPDLLVEGPLQYDAAVNPETARAKMKTDKSDVAGKATVLIFPDLNTGNNTYKAVQQSTGAVAMGPLLQGLRKPVNDLSRGCTVVDIVTTIALTAVQASSMKSKEAESNGSTAAAATS